MDEPTVTRNNYEFLGWFFEDVQWIFDEMPVLSDMELTAHWRLINQVENEYTVSFNPDGGILSGDNEIEVIENSFIEEPQISRENYEFLGWFTSDNTQWDFDTMRVTSNMTLTARWQLINNPGDVVFIVTFDPNGGETTSSLEVEVLENHKISPPQISRSGYRLVGW